MPAHSPTIEVEVLPGVAQVERWEGPCASSSKPFDLLIEVPHGADQRSHYEALRRRLVGELPEDLHEFFHANTDIGAWQYGCATASLLMARRPHLKIWLIRSLIPRTFIDCNRFEDTKEGGGITAGIQPYIDHPEDRNLLIKLHRSYIALVDEAYEKVMEGGGVAFIPHTYGPYELPISSVGRDIVEQLREAHRPERRNRLPVRPEIDLLTRQADGARIVEDQLVEALREKLEQAGFNVTESAVYRLVPGTQAWKHASRFPGRVLCLEVRRDLLVESYEALAPMRISWEGVLRVARPLADVIGGWLDGRGAISAPMAAA